MLSEIFMLRLEAIIRAMPSPDSRFVPIIKQPAAPAKDQQAAK
jgi:hypothetical protein